MAHDVLISYSSHDKLQADAVCNRLESKGIRCWIAPRDVPLGSEYADSIVQAIETAEVMVLIYSTHADESHQVRREVERAVSNGITIIPVRIENAAMSEAFQYYVGSMHWLDAISPPLEQHIDKLAHDLNALLSKSGSRKSRTDRDRHSAAAGAAAAANPVADEVPVVAAARTGAAMQSPADSYKAGESAGERIAPPANESQLRAAGSAAGQPSAAAPSPGSRRTIIAAAGISIVALLAAGGYYFFVGSKRTVTVPAVAKLSQREADEKLARAKLKVEKVVEEEHAQLDYPRVIRTVPEAGEASPRNGEVTLYISGMEILPDLTGVSEEQAKNKLREIGFHLVNVKPKASTKEEGTVLGTEPTPGRRLLRGKPVILEVAGTKVTVPDVLNLPIAQAEKQIAAANLKSKVERDWNKDVKLDAVFRVEPAPGTKANPGDTLTLFVSALGGWVYPEVGRLAKDQTFRLSTPRFLRTQPSNSSEKLGVVPTGKTARVLEAYGDGWAKVVVID